MLITLFIILFPLLQLCLVLQPKSLLIAQQTFMNCRSLFSLGGTDTNS